MKIKALAAMSLIVALAAAPAMAGKYGDAVVESPVDDSTVVVAPPPVGFGFGGLGVGGAVAAGVVGLAVLGAIIADDDPAPATTTE